MKMPFLQVIRLELDPELGVTTMCTVASQLWVFTQQYILREANEISVGRTGTATLMFASDVKSEKHEIVVLLGEFPATKSPPQISAQPVRVGMG